MGKSQHSLTQDALYYGTSNEVTHGITTFAVLLATHNRLEGATSGVVKSRHRRTRFVNIGKPNFGKRELRHGETSFFLHPGERLEKGIQDVDVLAEDETLLLQALETYFFFCDLK